MTLSDAEIARRKYARVQQHHASVLARLEKARARVRVLEEVAEASSRLVDLHRWDYEEAHRIERRRNRETPDPTDPPVAA